MKHKKLILILCSIAFFLAALTFYLNRAVFPQLIKKIAIEQAQNFLKRKVEIGAIHLNWIKGVVVDKIKIYQKDSAEDILAQVDQVSFSVILIPGIKQLKITIPFLNMRSPLAHFIRTADNTWNISDLLAPANAPPAAGKKPPSFAVTLGGITVTDGKLRVDDVSSKPAWTKFFDNINLKLSLSPKGIAYDFTAEIPQEKGSLAANVTYQPLTQNTQAQVHLKNINIASTLALIKIADVQLHSGIIDKMDLKINYNKEKTEAQGDAVLSRLDVAVPGLSASGDVRVNVHAFEFTKEGMRFDGSVLAKGLAMRCLNQTLKGDIALKPLAVRLRDENNISLEGNLNGQHIAAVVDGDKTFNGNITLQEAKLNLTNKKDIALSTKLAVEEMALSVGSGLKASGSLKAEKFLMTLADDLLKLSTTTTVQKGRLVLDGQKIIEASPQLELTLQVPLKTPQEMTYEGSMTIGEAQIQGFPVTGVKNIELDTDFKTDEATINALAFNFLGTDVHASGTVKNFKNPFLVLNAEANDLNLTKMKDMIPQIVSQYGLTLDGTSSLKVKFEGLVSDPWAGQILSVASLKNARLASSKFNQSVKDITGVVEATPDSLKWRDFTATYLGKQYTLTGTLDDFKNPKVTTTLVGEDVQLKASVIKNGDIVTIPDLTGRYLNIVFGAKGSVHLPQDGPPVLNITGHASLRLQDMLNFLPAEGKKDLAALKPTGMINAAVDIKGAITDWKNWTLNANVTSPLITVMGYKLNDLKMNIGQDEGKIKNLTLDGLLYDGVAHAVGSMDLIKAAMPFELALNISGTDLHKLKMDSPLKTEEINGKFYLTAIANGAGNDIKNLKAKGSLAIREGFLTEFEVFKGLLAALNEALRLGQLMITDVEANFIVEDQKITTENLRLKSPTIVLLGQGWVNFDQYCDLTMTVDLSSGIVPPIAEDALRTLTIHIYDKITKPKFSKKISVPEVINSIIKTIGIFQK